MKNALQIRNSRVSKYSHHQRKKIYKRLLIRKVKEEDIKEPKDVALLMEYEKKFLIIGNMNAICCKEIFPLIKDNRLWLGTCYVKEFLSKAGEIKKFGNILWYTNLAHKKRNTPLDLYKCYNEEEYQKYDNYNAINVKKVDEIPMDYDGVMGVPLTFIEKYCPTQFEILGIACGNSWANYPDLLKSLGFNPAIKYGGGLGIGVINGKAVYTRILIKRISK